MDQRVLIYGVFAKAVSTMKRTICTLAALGTVLRVCTPEVAMAANCAPSSGYDQLNQTQVEALIGSSMACYPVAGPPWTFQEYHDGSTTFATGGITDYKRGPGNPRDPSKLIGTYTIDATGVLISSYGGARSYSYTIWGNTAGGSGVYDFCNRLVPLPGGVRIAVGTAMPRSC